VNIFLVTFNHVIVHNYVR